MMNLQHLNILYKWSGPFASLLLLSEDCHASLLPAGEGDFFGVIAYKLQQYSRGWFLLRKVLPWRKR